MSDEDRSKWNARYREGAYADRDHPTALLADWAGELPAGRALDVACGAGRNSLFLAAAGRLVDAIDISAVGLDRARASARARGLAVNWIERDLELDASAVLPAGPYAVIVLVRYVNEALLPLLLARLAPGGMLLCEQHVETTLDVAGPRNPAFRLRANALLHGLVAAAGSETRVLFYREGLVTDPDGRRAALAQAVVRRE